MIPRHWLLLKFQKIVSPIGASVLAKVGPLLSCKRCCLLSHSIHNLEVIAVMSLPGKETKKGDEIQCWEDYLVDIPILVIVNLEGNLFAAENTL